MAIQLVLTDRQLSRDIKCNEIFKLKLKYNIILLYNTILLYNIHDFFLHIQMMSIMGRAV
jgi:hypothetical protein